MQGSDEIFLFCNPKSGGNKGQVFLQVPQPFVVPLREGGSISLRIFSLLDGESGKKPGFFELKKAVQRSLQLGRPPVRMIVGGGDGTIMWGVTEAEKVGIDVQKHVFVGVVPLGTGNDFARSAGWGGKNPEGILDNNCALLTSLVQLWCSATPKLHDVWQVEVEVDDEYGDIKRIDGGKTASMEVKSISKTMVNYCSFGQDSKIGVKFDQNRTKNQYGNYAVYAFACCTEEGKCWKAQHIGSFINSLHHGTDCDGEVVFDCDEDSENPKLVGDPEMCIIVNIASYAGGLCHLWQDDWRTGINPPSKTVTCASDPGDGKLEVVTVPNVAELATDTLLHNAGRVFSGGPLHFDFQQDDDEDIVAYHNVDGEFYKLINPVHSTITRTRVLQVLHNLSKPGTTLDQLNGMMSNAQHMVVSSVSQVGELASYQVTQAQADATRAVSSVTKMLR